MGGHELELGDTGTSSIPSGKQWNKRRYFFLPLVLITLVLVLGYRQSLNDLLWPKRFSVPYPYQWDFNKIADTTTPSSAKPVRSSSTGSVTSSAVPDKSQDYQADPRNYQFIMGNTEACKKRPPFLVLMIPVAANNVAARDAIRETWGNNSLVQVQGQVVLTLFMLGLSGSFSNDADELRKENLKHNDLIQSNFIDTYYNLTIKTMVIMDWLASYCVSATFAMKIDSDMFLNIDNLVNMLQLAEIPRENYMTGMLMWDRDAIHSKDSKWYVSEEIYPYPKFPTYTLGMGYVFSNDLPLKILEVSKSIQPFNIEDAYIEICMKMLGLSPVSPPDPWQFQAYSTGYDRCKFSRIITTILYSAKELVDYWTDLKKPGLKNNC